MPEILKILRERLEKLLATRDLSWAEMERIRKALEKLDELEVVFSDLSSDVQEVVTGGEISMAELMDRV